MVLWSDSKNQQPSSLKKGFFLSEGCFCHNNKLLEGRGHGDFPIVFPHHSAQCQTQQSLSINIYGVFMNKWLKRNKSQLKRPSLSEKASPFVGWGVVSLFFFYTRLQKSKRLIRNKGEKKAVVKSPLEIHTPFWRGTESALSIYIKA